MAKNAAVMLSEKAIAFVEKKVKAGEFKSSDEAVNAALQLMEDDDEKLQALRQAIQEGEESGIAEDFDFDEFIAWKRSNSGRV